MRLTYIPPGRYRYRPPAIFRTAEEEVLLDFACAALSSGARASEAAERAVSCHQAVNAAYLRYRREVGRELSAGAKHQIQVLACECLATGASGIEAATRAKETYRAILPRLKGLRQATTNRSEAMRANRAKRKEKRAPEEERVSEEVRRAL